MLSPKLDIQGTSSGNQGHATGGSNDKWSERDHNTRAPAPITGRIAVGIGYDRMTIGSRHPLDRQAGYGGKEDYGSNPRSKYTLLLRRNPIRGITRPVASGFQLPGGVSDGNG